LIVREAKKMNYRPHRYAQIMRVGRSGLIGVFHFGGLYQVAAERAWHVSYAIHAAGYQVLANDASWTEEGAKTGCNAMLDARVEGVIIAGPNDPSSLPAIEALRAAKIPIALLSSIEIARTPQVRADAQDAFLRLTRHMLKLGRKRILQLYSAAPSATEDQFWTRAERYKGFQIALAEANAKIVRDFSKTSSRSVEGRMAGLSVTEDPFDPFQGARATMKAILAQGPPPDAIICPNDDWAIGAMAALREAGLDVPSDVSVTGYDNIAVGAYLEVPLTTAAQPNKAMAEHAVDLLLKKIEGRRVPVEPIKFPCELIIRASCGAKNLSARS